MKVYIAGPMRGHAEFNHPAFHAAAALLREEGHMAFSPAEHDLTIGFDPTGLSAEECADAGVHGFDLRAALATDLDWICRQADAVATLPGWQASKGARAEVATAVALGLEVFEAPEGGGIA